MGGSRDVKDEISVKVRMTDQRGRGESMLEGIKGLLSVGVPDKRGVRAKKSKETMCGSSVVGNKSAKEISFALETLQLS